MFCLKRLVLVLTAVVAFGSQLATINDPRAVWQWMASFNFPPLDRETECNTTHACVDRRFG